MAEFMLIYQGGDPDWVDNTTPEQMASEMAEWSAWFAELEKTGKLRNPGVALAPATAIVSSQGVQTDAPMPEVKELVGGFSVVAAETIEEAAALAQGSPHLNHPGTTVAVRPVVDLEG